jgi:hypothetical protein
MWYEKLQQLCGKYYYLYLPAVLLIAGGILVWSDGPRALMFLLPVAAFILGVAIYGLQKALVELEKMGKLQEAHKALILEHQGLQTAAQAFDREGGFWLSRYLDLRLDRAAMLKALSRLLPAGYRIESYILETPLSSYEYSHGILDDEHKRDHFGPSGNPTQTFLYLDYGKDNPAGQLRLRVSADDIGIIGDLPDYEKLRVSLIEADSREAWRRYLTEVKLAETA